LIFCPKSSKSLTLDVSAVKSFSGVIEDFNRLPENLNPVEKRAFIKRGFGILFDIIIELIL